MGLGVAFVYAFFKKYFMSLLKCLHYGNTQANKFFPSAKVSGEITPEYLGVGYIIGPKIAGVLVAGGVLSWFVFIPLLASFLVNADFIAAQLVKLGYLDDITKPGGPVDGIRLHMDLLIGLSAIYRLISGKSVQVL